MIGAAHAACFSMALALKLGEAGLTPERIETHADVTLAKTGREFTITASHLTVVARIPGADDQTFQEIANATKLGCPVSRLLRAKITLYARLEA